MEADQNMVSSDSLGFSAKMQEDQNMGSSDSLGFSAKKRENQNMVNSCIETSEGKYLGLKLRNDSSLLSLIEKKLITVASNPVETKKVIDVPITSTEKAKASNFHATLLRIGNWKRVALYEGEIVAKIYFAKRKLVWEILERPLKYKIEVLWSDITAIEATYGNAGLDILKIEVSQPPLFFRETNPQPKKHTIWQSSSDFTEKQASRYRRHYLEFSEGTLKKHYEKLILSDMRLKQLTLRGYQSHSSVFFATKSGVTDFGHDYKPNFVTLDNQQPRNRCNSQLPNISNSQYLISTPSQFNEACDPLSIMETYNQVMAMDPVSLAINPVLDEENNVGLVDPGYQHLENHHEENQIYVDNNILNDSYVGLWDQGCENTSLNPTIEPQKSFHEVLPLNLCSAPAPNLSFEHVSIADYIDGNQSNDGYDIKELQDSDIRLQMLEDCMLNERHLVPPDDEQDFFTPIENMKFLLSPELYAGIRATFEGDVKVINDQTCNKDRNF